MKNQIKLIAVIVLLIVIVIFALQNTNSVELDLFFASYQVPLVLIILFTLLIGVIGGLATSATAANHYRRENNDLKRQLKTSDETRSGETRYKDDQIAALKDQVAQLEAELKNKSVAQDSEVPPQG